MATVTVEIYILYCSDVTNRYLGVMMDASLGCDWDKWKYRIVVGPKDVGKKVLSLDWTFTEELGPNHKLYVNITDYAFNVEGWYGKWNVEILIKEKTTGKVLAHTIETISKAGPCSRAGGGGNAVVSFTIPAGTTTTFTPGGVTTTTTTTTTGGTTTTTTTNTTFNWEQTLKDMMDKMIPPMMQIMMMGMMMQMMTGMITEVMA